MERERRHIRVTGTVQGVGFRPFVYRTAVELGLDGHVANDSLGVLIEAEGTRAALDELCRRLTDQPPPLARVTAVDSAGLPCNGGERGFRIVVSRDAGSPDVPVSVDVAPCPACLAELRDPADRRYRYPFINCTDCGPRYTITRRIPYDRPHTTMAGFVMCPPCQAEYDDPADRRFHAQPNACPGCGPRTVLCDPSGTPQARGDAALHATVARLLAGEVLAVKGVGGFHLAVDATSAGAVAELRRRKARDDKPFALLVSDLAAARRLVALHPDAAAA
ncbi:MAG TPA: acylphosphatase, partial [Nitriliruptorales bacterium]|nr:acylphosphatase [Nitriliruptorales bacterium]